MKLGYNHPYTNFVLYRFNAKNKGIGDDNTLLISIDVCRLAIVHEVLIYDFIEDYLTGLGFVKNVKLRSSVFFHNSDFHRLA